MGGLICIGLFMLPFFLWMAWLIYISYEPPYREGYFHFSPFGEFRIAGKHHFTGSWITLDAVKNENRNESQEMSKRPVFKYENEVEWMQEAAENASKYLKNSDYIEVKIYYYDRYKTNYWGGHSEKKELVWMNGKWMQ